MTSDASVNAYPTWGAYGVTKAALDHLRRVWAAELEATGVDVLAVDPGEMDTRMHADAMPDADRATAPGARARRRVRSCGSSRASDPWKSGDRVEAAVAAPMIAAAAWPRERPEDERLLWIDPAEAAFADAASATSPRCCAPGISWS